MTVSVKGTGPRRRTRPFVDLFGASNNALIALRRGIGTLLNDDQQRTSFKVQRQRRPEPIASLVGEIRLIHGRHRSVAAAQNLLDAWGRVSYITEPTA